MSSRQNDYDSFRVSLKRQIKITLLLSVALVAGIGQSSAYGVDYRDALKLYAHSQLVNDEQYQCFYKLITKESNWRVNAVGNIAGTHRVYGIPQGKSEWLKDQDGYTQVVWGLNYIGNRYGEPCIALDHWSKYGWH